MAGIPTLEELKRLDTSHDLILSLTLTGEIIQFNKESEQVTGYPRDEVLHKNLNDILVPKESIKQWKDLLDSIQQDMWIDNFVLPIKTKDNQIQMITWTGFLVKDEHGTIKDICIFGKPLQTERIEKSTPPSSEPVIQQKEPESEPEVERVVNPAVLEEIPQPPKRDVPMKHGVNKIMFAREKKNTEIPMQAIDLEKSHSPSVPMEKPIDRTTQQFDRIHQSLADLSQKYQTISERVAELEKRDQQWEKKGIPQDTDPLPSKEEDTLSPENQHDVASEPQTIDQQPTAETEPSFFSKPFGLTHHHKDLSLKKQELELRTKELEAYEARLQREEHTFNARVEEFSRWQEKLMLLEAAIEKRRQELMTQENLVLEKSTVPPMAQTMNLAEPDVQKTAETEGPHRADETLDKIPQSAAIIQRGIVKQMNNLFLELLGYSMEEIVEKSYFDFIALEGLADVEKYYLDRLKGDSVSVYRTVISTKENTKIPVEVIIKQTIYNGEKAEIAIITCLDPRQG